MTARTIRHEPPRASAPTPFGRPRAWATFLPALAQSFLLFAAVGMSLGLGLWLLRADSLVEPYLLHNQINKLGRVFILADMFGGAAALCIGALLCLVVKGIGVTPALHRAAWRLSPLIPLGLLPMLFDWRLWRDRDLTFLLLAAAVGFSFRLLMQRAMEAQTPAFQPPRWWRSWTSRLRWPVLSTRMRRRLPLATVLFCAAMYAAYFAYRTIEYHWNLRTSSFDLGLEENLVWNALHGTPRLFKSSPFAGPNGTHFGNHVTFFAYVLAPFYWFYQKPETLLVIQAILIGGASVPLFLFARRYLGDWPAVFVAVIYLFNPAVHGTNLYDYHYLPLGPFFLWLSLYALEARRPILTVVAILLTLSVREDVGGGLAIVGGYLLMTGRRPVAGMIVACIGAGYLALMKLVLMPMVAGGSESFLSIYSGMLPPGESSFGGVLKTAIANPAFTIHNLLESQKLIFFLQIMIPLGFLPFMRPIGLLCVLPGLLFTLFSTNYSPVIELGFQYPAHWTSFMFIALVANLAYAFRPTHAEDRGGRFRRNAWMAGLAVSTLAVSYQYGVIFQSNVARAGFGSARFGTTESDRALRKDLYELIALVPPRAKIVSSEKIVPQIANRPDSYTLRVGVYDAEYMLLDMRGFTSEEKTNARKAFQEEKFGVVETRGHFVLAKRGVESEQTAGIVARIR